ncbi:MAG: hypothetical protein J6Y13_06480 [Treponema sp.]|nr:hypothetical protein [Treponema sp.]
MFHALDEFRINLCICAAAVLLYLLTGIRGLLKLRKRKRLLEGEGKTLPPADRKFVPSVVTSAILLVLPLLVYFKPYITAVLEACAVLGLHITLRERLGGEKTNRETV